MAPGSVPYRGARTPQAAWCGQKQRCWALFFFFFQKKKSPDFPGANASTGSDSQLPTWCPDVRMGGILPWALGGWREPTLATCSLHHHPDHSSRKPNLQLWVFISLSSNVRCGEKRLTFPCLPSPFMAPTHSGRLTTRRVRSLSLWHWLVKDPQCSSFGIWGTTPGCHQEGPPPAFRWWAPGSSLGVLEITVQGCYLSTAFKVRSKRWKFCLLFLNLEPNSSLPRT